jgi:peroxiredoxin
MTRYRPILPLTAGVCWTRSGRATGRAGRPNTTFIVDADGRIVAVLRKVTPADHDELVLEALAGARPPVV